MACINAFVPTVPRGSENPFYHCIHQRRYDKQVTFTMFDDHYDPRVHRKRYHLETIYFENNDNLAKLFPLHLKLESFLWFSNFPNESITCFDDVVNVFLDRYNLFMTQ